MNAPIQVSASDFILQSLSTIGSRIPKKQAYILLIKSYRCIYCIQYMPAYEQFASKFPNTGFLVLEASENSAMLKQWAQLDSPAYTIDGYPTVIAYNLDGNPSHIVKDRNQLNIDIMQLLL